MTRLNFRTLRLLLLSLVLAAVMFMGISHTAAAAEEEGEEPEKYSVEYFCMEGYYEVDGERYDIFTGLYDPGSYFNPVTPVPYSEQLLFGGWFTRTLGRGEQLTEETVIDREGIVAYAYWYVNPEKVPAMTPDTVYPLEVSGGGTLYSFTPSETATYEISTMGNKPEMGIANLRILDASLNALAISSSIDYDYNAVVSMELTAGTTYYIEFASVFGDYVIYDAVLKKSEFIEVTFHANCEPGEAYFDDDPSVTEKTMSVRKGAHLENYKDSGLTIGPDATMYLDGWSLNPDASDPDQWIIAEEHVDLYAVYYRYFEVILDANGGYMGLYDKELTQITYSYQPYEEFGPAYEPEIDDETRSFAGWARTPDATEAEIHNGQLCGDLGDILYAVYTEPVKVTFDAAGGKIFGNPDYKTMEFVYGKGHVFEPLHVEHDNQLMDLIGWRDQHGVIIPAGSSADPNYLYTEDTYLTAIWGRYVTADANGACFHFIPDYTRVSVLVPAEDPFYTSYIIQVHGEPINFNDLKYLAGWATTPDAEEPDITEGAVLPPDLAVIFAIWKDDVYYLADGAGQSWEKGGTEGLTFTVKREFYDEMTFSCFAGVSVDGKGVAYPLFTRKEGSNILTLTPEFLETLEPGQHTIAMEFTEDQVVETTFTVTAPEEETDPSDKETDPSDKETDPSDKETDPSGKETDPSDKETEPSGKETDPAAPDTGDHTDLSGWILLMALSLAGIAGIAVYSAVRRKRSE